MSQALPATITSPQDLRAVILEVRQYAQWFSHATVKMRAGGAADGQPAAVSEAAAGLIKASGADGQINQAALDQLIANLEDLEETAPQIAITLAAPPAASLQKTLVAWCRKNVAPNILVNFQFNSTLLGGMVVRYNSHVFDWSFRRQILAARGKFPEVLRRV